MLINQLEELKGEKIKQYSALAHRPLRQTVSWEKPHKNHVPNAPHTNHRTTSCDAESAGDAEESLEGHWSSDCSNSDEDEQSISAANAVSVTRVGGAWGLQVDNLQGFLISFCRSRVAGCSSLLWGALQSFMFDFTNCTLTDLVIVSCTLFSA